MVLDIMEWLAIMKKYENGGFGYYTTLPTDSLITFAHAIAETEKHGFGRAEGDLRELGTKVRAAFEHRGYKSVAAPGWQAPGVVVSYTPDEEILPKLKSVGVQVAAGVNLKLGEDVTPKPTSIFRIGLFGIDKLYNVDNTVSTLLKAMDEVGPKCPRAKM